MGAGCYFPAPVLCIRQGDLQRGCMTAERVGRPISHYSILKRDLGRTYLMKKRNQCLVIILSLMIGIIYPVSETSITDAAGEPFITTDSVVLQSKGDSKTIFIKNIKKNKIKNLTVKSRNKSVAGAVKLSKKSFLITAACDDGYTQVSALLKLKKKIRGRKKYSFLIDVDVVEVTSRPTHLPETTAGPTSTPMTTASPSPTSTSAPTSTATVKPSPTPTATVKPSPTPTAVVKPSPTPTATVKPSSTPTPGPTASATTLPDENAVYERMMAMQAEYPEGKPWTNNNKYRWINVTAPNTTYTFGGCAAYAAIISDAGFGEGTPAKQVMNPDPATVRIGDILRINGDTHSVVVIGIEDDYFVLTEGNYNNSIHWGRKIRKTDPIDFLFTRW